MTTSWVIIDKRTGKAVFETFRKYTADKVRPLKGYKAVPILEWLVSLNAKDT